MDSIPTYIQNIRIKDKKQIFEKSKTNSLLYPTVAELNLLITVEKYNGFIVLFSSLFTRKALYC
jgi:hypothetical protein